RGICSFLQTWWSAVSIDWCATCYYLTGRREYAEDLAQETWIRVLQRGSQYNGRQRFDPWLFAIARNLAIDYLRKKQKAVQTASLPNDREAMLLLLSSDPSPFEAAARSEDAMRL